MKTLRKLKLIAVLMSFWMTFFPLRVFAEDIDIYTGGSAGTSNKPNVLIVLDNTANWSRQSQQWPGGLAQGQSEVRAIKTVLGSIGTSVRVGLFEFQTDGNAAANESGKVRHRVSSMSDENRTTLSGILDTIYGDINGVLEKRSTGAPYGTLFYDVYNYFAGANASSTAGVSGSSRVDSYGYTSAYSTFRAPLSSERSCAKSYVIFISNPQSSGPTSDSAANLTALAGLGGTTSQLGLPQFSSVTANVATTVGTTNSCYATQAACTTAQAAAGTAISSACTDGTYSAGCACTTASADVATACASGTQRYSVIGTLNAGSTNLGYTSTCYSNTSSCSTSDYAASCTGTGISCACDSGTYVTTGCSGSKKKFMVVKTNSLTTTTNLGYTSGCYASSAACATTDYTTSCLSYSSCACGSPTTTSASCAAGTSKYVVTGTNAVTTNTPTGTYVTDAATYNADEWARFLFEKGVPVSGTTTKQNVATYTIDVYNAQPNATHTSLMMSMAKAGGGKYFSATNESAITTALRQIFAEIMSVNSTFASASLPTNTTNRTQNENQVYIGLFRPDPNAKPRWFGNLKRYQVVLAADGINLVLGDKTGAPAVNTQTGFIDACAVSWWTVDSSTFWQNYPVNPSPAGTCTGAASGGGTYDDDTHKYSDYPDGPQVEKGAVAQMLRKGNNPPITDTTAAAGTVDRTIYSTDVSAFATNSPTAGNDLSLLSSLSTLATTAPSQKDWTQGKDVMDENSNSNTTETRASIHGDVVHSQPLPVTYSSGIVIYYGANDGHLRAVDAETGKEKWSFIPYEFTTARTAYVNVDSSGVPLTTAPASLGSTYDPQGRLRDNSPFVDYPYVSSLSGMSPTPINKDYFWDGSIGLHQNADNSKILIYPTMRRGGRMIYAMNTTNPAVPSIAWKVGCPKLDNDTGCISVSGIGQTWSKPNLAPVKGYSTTTHVAFVGGGYDTCEDADTASPSCGSAKGRAVYAFDAENGSLLATLPTTRSVAGDVALLDIDGDGYYDYAYVLDTGGNLYRISMVSRSVDAATGTVTHTAMGPGSWTITRVAYTSGSGRKFLYAPALFSAGAKLGKVYLAMGSGDREHPLATNYTFGVSNKIYVFLDDLSSTATTDLDGASMIDFDSTPQSCVDGKPAGTMLLPTAGYKGWFQRLPGTGEQTVTSALISGGEVLFNTNRAIAAAEGTCSTSLGEARGYRKNLLNGSGAIGVTGSCGGSQSSVFAGGGLPPSPVMGTVPVGGKMTTVVIGAAQKGGGANSPVSPQKVTPTISSTRKRVYSYSSGDN